MTVHSFHVFDRRGKTLFTKNYTKKGQTEITPEEEEQLSEQRKLVFGMLFSLRELAGSLTDGQGDLHLVKTGASSLYTYETVSGLRFVLYTTAETSKKTSSSSSGSTSNQSNADAPLLSVNPATGMINSATAESNSSSHNSSYHGTTNPAVTNEIRSALKYIYETIWIHSVIRSPMYRPTAENHAESIQATNFEAELDSYLKRKSWYR